MAIPPKSFNRATNPPPPDHSVALVTVPSGMMTSSWWQWLTQSLHWHRMHTTTAKRPTGLQPPDIGFQMYDETLHKPIWWDGFVWRDATGAIA